MLQVGEPAQRSGSPTYTFLFFSQNLRSIGSHPHTLQAKAFNHQLLWGDRLYRVIRAGKAPKFYLWGHIRGEFIRSDTSLL
ncbi:hypothetical protein LC613_05025 [Nostoc sphaeroides CHAB 2801]|uniref:hypothetical protein n=1 Tax=Nostoc sphaeroides TaxID=446679 RepID=UPI000E46986E|nr:hypothetical protein [Nostoc sphaeroides]MCC5627546.1 hypothetical protein [Nostoc sphaeroides CHAB 2801]